MSQITTHILDTSRGRPAPGVRVRLERQAADHRFVELASGFTDADGRVQDLTGDEELSPGVHRLVFDTGCYHGQERGSGFYPSVTIEFLVDDASQHYHVPLLLSPFGYSTYRGS